MKLVIDHIVVAAPDLDSGARHVARLLGVEPARGGAHPAWARTTACWAWRAACT